MKLEDEISKRYVPQHQIFHTKWIEVKSHSRATLLSVTRNLKYRGHEKSRP